MLCSGKEREGGRGIGSRRIRERERESYLRVRKTGDRLDHYLLYKRFVMLRENGFLRFLSQRNLFPVVVLLVSCDPREL
jgi:hypothetical protein